MKAKQKSSKTKRKSAKRPAATQRTAPRKVRPLAPRRASARTTLKRKRAVAKRRRAKPKRVKRIARMQMPPILLEGDRPVPPPLSGPGDKFVLAGSSPAQADRSESVELPEAYGTGRLFLTTRDPHWLYAHWDFTREQQRQFNARSAHGHLVLRTYLGAPQGKPVSEIHVHPESRHWFAHVERAATEYSAELGYYRRDHKWTRVAASPSTLMPPDTVSPDTSVTFSTIPVEMSFEKLLASVGEVIPEHIPLALALEELRQRGEAETPVPTAVENPVWTPEQERALVEVIRTDISPCAWMDSLAISELVQGWEQPGGEISSAIAAGFGPQSWSAGAEEGISSPLGGPPLEEKGFWFNVNAELVIYGATEPDATVTIGGRIIELRPDGSFTHRFALPNGQYTLSVAAVSADGTDWRAAELIFTRATALAGEVGTHPQDPGLKPPAPENVA